MVERIFENKRDFAGSSLVNVVIGGAAEDSFPLCMPEA
jgi:hypothetical protein